MPEVITLRVTRETIKRTLRTFLQAAVSYIVIHTFVIDFTDTDEVIKRALIGLAVSAISAGIAAVMNLERVDEE